MARIPSFQRKGGPPALMVAIGTPKDGGQADGGSDDESGEGPEMSGPDETHDEKDIAVCPNCGCTFNDETGKIIPEGHPQHPMMAAGGASTGDDTGDSY